MINNTASISTESPIRRVRVLSTGLAEQHKEHRYGSRLPKTIWALLSRSWIKIPINVFVIEHRDGLLLFDAGLAPAVVSNPDYVNSAIGRFFMKRVFRLHINPADTLSDKLDAIGYAASDVCKVIISHLHFDHVGCIGDVPQADLLVSRIEWSQLSKPNPERHYIFREHIEIPGAKWMPFDFVKTDDPLLEPFGGSFDVMGDGSVVLIPTPGHTAGSLSMLVRTGNYPPLLLIGDLAYDADLLMRDQLPGIYASKAQLLSSYARVRALRAQLPDLLVLASHDPAVPGALSSIISSTTGETSGKE